MILHGDCLGFMPFIPDASVDMILCDLPYGTTECKWDVIIPMQKLWENYERIIKPNGAILLFAQTPFDKILGCSNLNLLRNEWIWEKPKATGSMNANKMQLKAHENILVFYKKLPTYNPQFAEGEPWKKIKNKNVAGVHNRNGLRNDYSSGSDGKRYPRSVIKFSSDQGFHPTQKPVALLEYLIKTYTNVGDTVLDNCMGSGSTGVAALQCGRQFIGMEKDENYFLIAQGRINELR